jgi:hypothetical protein
MNYFAHGYRYIDRPYFMAGTAVPDWLNVSDRGVRVRSKHARPFVDDADPQVAELARGIAQHHQDDRWFHDTPAFAQTNYELAARIRDCIPDDGLRPSFLGHILVEILLDAELIAEDHARLDDYYRAMESLDPATVQAAVNRMAPVPATRLGQLLPLFLTERFLEDYLDDKRLLYRLNQVMRRVKLSTLPTELLQLLPDARRLVAQRREELLTQPVEVVAGPEDTGSNQA